MSVSDDEDVVEEYQRTPRPKTPVPSPQEQKRLTHTKTTEEGMPGSPSFLPTASAKSINTGPAASPSPLPEFDPSKDVITNKVLGDYTSGALKVKQIDSPEEHRARGGQFFATPDKGGSNYAGYIPPRQQASPMPSIPKFDIFNPASIMDTINTMIPYAMQAKRNQAATEREKALSSIGVDEAQVKKMIHDIANPTPVFVQGYEGEQHVTKQYNPGTRRADIPVMKGAIPKEFKPESELDRHEKLSSIIKNYTEAGIEIPDEVKKMAAGSGGKRKPTWEEFLPAARKVNPGMSDAEIKQEYDKRYSGRF